MLKQLFNTVFGTRFDRELKRIQPIIDKVKEHERRLAGLPDDAIRGQTEKLRAQIRERTGALETEIAEKRQTKHDTADAGAREGLDREIHNLEDDLHAALRAAL